jgi:hypothetical protein
MRCATSGAKSTGGSPLLPRHIVAKQPSLIAASTHTTCDAMSQLSATNLMLYAMTVRKRASDSTLRIDVRLEVMCGRASARAIDIVIASLEMMDKKLARVNRNFANNLMYHVAWFDRLRK